MEAEVARMEAATAGDSGGPSRFNEPVPMDAANVRSFGARGDGSSDDTEAFQRALDKAGADGMGGTVYVPKGHYLIAGNLRIPPNVTLRGTWEFIPTADKYWNKERKDEPLPGSVLLSTAGEGQEDGAPFITLDSNSALKGLTIFYPNQVKSDTPKPYPWTVGIVEGGASHCTLIDVLMVNPYQAVDFGSQGSSRHFIRNLYAYPLRRGIFIDRCYDIGRIENAHIWPFWGYTGEQDPVARFVSDNAEAFIIGRTDWEYITNSFSIFYRIGFHFIRTESGSANVLLSQSGADICENSILVDDCMAHAGISFLNSQLFGRVTVKDTNSGPIRFTGCGFFGATRERVSRDPGIAEIAGKAPVTFDNCHFITLDGASKSETNIVASGGGIMVANSFFMDSGRTQFRLEPGLSTAVIMGNTFRGPLKVVNNSQANVQIGLNADGFPEIERPAVP